MAGTSILSGWGNYPKIATEKMPFGNKVSGNRIYRGMGRSYGDQAVCENGITIETFQHNRILSFSNGIIKVQSGITLREIIHATLPKGYLPIVNPGTEYVTVGGAIANDIHGKGHHIDGSFINSVKSFLLVLADGSELNCSRNQNTELFFAVAGGCGLLGFISEAELWLKPIKSAYFNTKSFVAKNIDQMLELLDDEGLKWHYTVGWIDTMKSDLPGVLVCGNHFESDELAQNELIVNDKEPIDLPNVFPNGLLNGVSIPVLNKLIEVKQKALNGKVHYQPFFFPLDIFKNWNLGYGSNGFIQYQFVIPLQNGHQNLKLILKAIEKSGCKPFLNVIKRFGEPTGKFLSFPIEGYTLALDFALNKNVVTLAKHLNQLVAQMGGRVYLAKDALLNGQNIRQMYPQLEQLLSLRKQLPQYQLFNSALATRLNF